MNASNAAEDLLTCAGCGGRTTKAEVTGAGYRCPRCELELAHLDTAPNGSVRGVIAWLRAPGDVLEDRYRVTQLLGRGGFAVTYLVEDQLLKGKRRALKEVPEILFDEGEADILSRIEHPAVPDITDRSTRDGMVRLVLEFGGSRSLETVRQDEGGRIGVARITPWVAQLCDVLGYLHQQDPPIVHRDLKPENILLDDRDRVKIIDFGIAKEGHDGNVTRTIARAVSHGFSPPEQAMGTGTDQRSDVYALGATAYALLTGQPPVPAHERVTGQEIVPPSTLQPEIGPELEAVLLRAMSLNILQRYESIQEFGEAFAASGQGAAGATAARTVAIDQIAASMPPTGARPATGPGLGTTGVAPAAPAGHKSIGPAVWLGAGVLVLGAIGAVAWFTTREAPAPAATPFQQAGTAPVSAGPVEPPALPIPPPTLQFETETPGEEQSALAAFDAQRVPDPDPPPEPVARQRSTTQGRPPRQETTTTRSRREKRPEQVWGEIITKEILRRVP